MGKNRKPTTKYQNPDDTTINRDVENKSEVLADRVETTDNFSNLNSSSIVDSSNKPDTNLKAPEKKKPFESVSMKSSEIQNVPESMFTNYISVRIVGRHKFAGKRLMSPLTIANMVIEDNRDCSILVSEQTARLIRNIIMNYGNRLNNKSMTMERKEQILSRFENNLKRFKF